MPNDLLRDKLASLDDLAIKAIRSVFDEAIEKSNPDVILGEDNLILGQKFRAYVEAKKMVEQAFLDINSYKITKAPDNSFNKER